MLFTLWILVHILNYIKYPPKAVLIINTTVINIKKPFC